MRILESIRGHEDLTKLTEAQRGTLCREIREFIVSHVANTGGHLASNLGVVELTVAIETVYNTASDRLVFDVGHQSYVHKLLTGRQADFERLRMFGGISGFPKPRESVADAFVAGHASSSVSIALGMARARKLTGAHYHVAALIGDGAFTGGMAYEGINDAGGSKEPMVVILNDNEMSIDRNVGGLAAHLSRIRTRQGYSDFKKKYRSVIKKVPGGEQIYRFTHQTKELVKRSLLRETIFESMGFEYLGPVDGHDLPLLIQTLKAARDMGKPVLVHVVTQKGRGYSPAEKNPAKFHGVGKFNPVNGKSLAVKKTTFSDVFGETMTELAGENPKLCAITAAMPAGTGLLQFQKAFPDRLFDVGIAEEHAVSMAGGLAKQGAVPVVAIYSTFLQRGYDQILQDVALEGLHVVFAVDRAGLVGEDGPTHHGVFDVGYLSSIPGMTVLCPGNFQELRDMLRWAVNDCTGPVAVRYPRGGEGCLDQSHFRGDPAEFQVITAGNGPTLISYGTVAEEAALAVRSMGRIENLPTMIRLLSTTHISAKALAEQITGGHVFVVEETQKGSGIKERLAWALQQEKPGLKFHGLDLGPEFVPHGDLRSLYRQAGLDNGSIANHIREVLSHEDKEET